MTRLASRLLGTLILLTLVHCPKTPEDKQLAEVKRSLAAIVATCTSVVGDVQLRRAGAEYWEKVHAPAVLRAGDWLRTGTGGFARVEFARGGNLAVEESALVAIDEVRTPHLASGQTLVSVASGTVRGSLKPREDGGETPLLIANEDGSRIDLRPVSSGGAVEFRLTRAGRGTEIALSEGEAILVASKRELVVHAGQRTDFGDGGLGEVVELINFPRSIQPRVDARFLWKPDLSISLIWSAVPGAKGYRIQIARDLSFTSLVETRESEGSTLGFVAKIDGTYAWRVASHDAAGRYGEYGFARRIFCEKVKPREHLLAPKDGAVFGYVDSPPKLVFSWQSIEGAEQYRLVVADGADLVRQAVHNEVSAGQRITLGNLGAGKYVWGVYVGGDSPIPIFLKPRRLVVKKVGAAEVETKLQEWGK